MNLATLSKIVQKSYRRVGRGHGSGRVKTSGRGTKGQKARGTIPVAFAGSSLQASWLKRLPLMRGKGKNKSFQKDVEVLNLNRLNKFKAGSTITLVTLIEAGVINKLATRVKIVDNGEITVALRVKVPASAGAAKKIEKAGGSVEPI